MLLLINALVVHPQEIGLSSRIVIRDDAGDEIAAQPGGRGFYYWDGDAQKAVFVTLEAGGKRTSRTVSLPEVAAIAANGRGDVFLASGQYVVRLPARGAPVKTNAGGSVQTVGPDGSAVVVRKAGPGLWRNGRFLKLPPMAGGVGGGLFRFSPNGAKLLRVGEVAGRFSSVEVIDSNSAKIVAKARLGSSDVRVASWAGEGKIGFAGEGGWACRMDAKTLRTESHVVAAGALNTVGAFSPDGRTYYGQGVFRLDGRGTLGIGMYDLGARRFRGVLRVVQPAYALFFVGRGLLASGPSGVIRLEPESRP